MSPLSLVDCIIIVAKTIKILGIISFPNMFQTQLYQLSSAQIDDRSLKKSVERDYAILYLETELLSHILMIGGTISKLISRRIQSTMVYYDANYLHDTGTLKTSCYSTYNNLLLRGRRCKM